ncbi:hypothetical protein [Leisingera caerulea]|uniref:hypothetical protein n=1 Tax=Leisingera caerulea TaxID=506591 RepID=UPI00047F900A|nr:hypothetical protein [Leisingera caerulea]
MRRPIVTFPLELVRLLEVNWDIDWRSQSLGVTTSGASATVFNAFPRWVGTPEFRIPKERLGLWRAIRWQAQGRAGIYRVPMVDPHVSNLRRMPAWVEYSEKGIPFSGGAHFSNGLGFAFEPRLVVAQIAKPGDETLFVEVTSPDYRPNPGQIMSFGDWPFAVLSVADEGGSILRLGVQMQRREIGAGETVKLLGTGLFEVSSDETGRLAYQKDGIARPKLILQEYIQR